MLEVREVRKLYVTHGNKQKLIKHIDDAKEIVKQWNVDIEDVMVSESIVSDTEISWNNLCNLKVFMEQK